MNTGLYISTAGLKAQETRQAVIANNIANAKTTGFKRDLMVMQSRLNASMEDPKMFPYRLPVMQNQGGGVYAVGSGIDLTQSNFETSGSATDVALNGPGFFTLAGENGQKLLTRDGRFVMDQDGGLVTAVGKHPVLDNTGKPIVLNIKVPVDISPDGQITQGADDQGVKLGLSDVADSRHLLKLGGNVMAVDKPEAISAASADTRVLQYQLEASGVDPMVEIVNMMEGQRAFDANARMITYQDQTLSQLNTIGRVA